MINTCSKPSPEEIPEIILPGEARMMVLFSITLPGPLQEELKIIFFKALQDCSWPGQDDGISSRPGSSGIASPSMNASPVILSGLGQ